MVDRTSLLKRQALTGLEGSNPSGSANIMNNIKKTKIISLIILLTIFIILAFLITPSKPIPPIKNEVVTNNNVNSLPFYPRQLTKLAEIRADMSSIRMVDNSDYYAIDNSRVYWIFPEPRVVEGADLESFKTWAGTFAIDKNHVYLTGYKVEGVDPKTFSPIIENQDIVNSPYFKDENSVFFKKIVNVIGDYHYTLIKVNEADTKTIRAVNDYIVADENYVYYEGKKVSGLDGKTFVMIEKPYFQDINGIYFFNEWDKKTITPISLPGVVKIFTNHYAKGGYLAIGNKIFMGTSTVMNADPITFYVFEADARYGEKEKEMCRFTNFCLYAGDKEAVYYNGQKLPAADPKTFTLIGYGLLKNQDVVQPRYAKDRSNVYYDGEVVDGADPDTFTPLISGGYYLEYGRDADSVYWKSKLINKADPMTFSIFGGQQPYESCAIGRYSKDKNNVYYQNILIDGADPKTFKPKHGSGAFGEDALHFYKEGNIADPKEFVECDYG